jgi:hypothetical protein
VVVVVVVVVEPNCFTCFAEYDWDLQHIWIFVWKSMSLFLVVAWIVYLPVSDCHLSLITLIEIVLHAE